MKNVVRTVVMLLCAVIGSAVASAQCPQVTGELTEQKIAATVNCLVKAQMAGGLLATPVKLPKGQISVSKNFNVVAFVVAPGDEAKVAVPNGIAAHVGTTGDGNDGCTVGATLTSVTLKCNSPANSDLSVLVIVHPKS